MPALESDSLLGTEQDAADDGKHLWSSLLKEVTHKASVKLPSSRALIVLGDDECGKTTLIARLQGTEDPKKSFGLEYAYIDVKDEDRDDNAKLNVWILDGDPIHSHLLKFRLNAETFGDCLVVIVVSMDKPWNIMDSLEQWTDVLSKHITRISIPSETLHEYKSALVDQFREYVEPDTLGPSVASPAPVAHAPLASVPIGTRRNTGTALHPATAALLRASMTGQQQVQTGVQVVDQEPEQPAVTEIPLDGTTLSENLGIPVVVVVTKTDAMNTLEKEDRYTEEHFDFIQMHIRLFCLRHGAALFYVSVKEDKNCDLLNRYIQSRIYGFQFNHAAYVVERDCIFVPTGWDSEKKIDMLTEIFTQFRSDDGYNSVIQRPTPRKKLTNEPEFQAPDEQTFLTHLLANCQRETGSNAPPSGGNLDVPPSSTSAVTTGQASPRPSSGGVRTKPSPSGPGASASGRVSGVGGAGRTSEGVLATFFTSLLNKGSTNPATAAHGTSQLPNTANSPGKFAPSTMSSKDMQSELERLARSSRETLEGVKPQVKPVPVANVQNSTEMSEPADDGAPVNDETILKTDTISSEEPPKSEETVKADAIEIPAQDAS